MTERPDDRGEADNAPPVGPLGSATDSAGDPGSSGAAPDPADGIAGPSYPPAETEPDAHGRS